MVQYDFDSQEVLLGRLKTGCVRFCRVINEEFSCIGLYEFRLVIVFADIAVSPARLMLRSSGMCF